MSKLDAAGRLIQWAIELNEFNIKYRPRRVIKSQALIDFIAEFTMASERPPQDKKEPKEKWEVNIDGSFVKGARGVGIVFKTLEGRLLKYVVQLQYPTTNNKVEYEAFLIVLCIAKVLGVTTLKVQSDSQLVVGQVNSEYEAKEERMKKYLDLVRSIMTSLNEIVILQMPREQNIEADTLAKLASSKEAIDQ